MVAEPLPAEVTRPEVLTVATLVLLEDQVTVLLAASLGVMVALNCEVAP